ncbi:hypothetical protein OSTOST_15974 [Ostertagia ostertagi]
MTAPTETNRAKLSATLVVYSRNRREKREASACLMKSMLTSPTRSQKRATAKDNKPEFAAGASRARLHRWPFLSSALFSDTNPQQCLSADDLNNAGTFQVPVSDFPASQCSQMWRHFSFHRRAKLSTGIA